MSTDVCAERSIGRPSGEVAAHAMDPANDLTWIGGLREAEVLTDGPVGPGTRVRRVAGFLGRKIEYVNEIVEHDPPRRLVMRSVKAPFPMTVTYEFESADGGAATRASVRVQGDAGGFYRLAAPLLSAQVRRSVAADLRRLKEHLELG